MNQILSAIVGGVIGGLIGALIFEIIPRYIRHRKDAKRHADRRC